MLIFWGGAKNTLMKRQQKSINDMHKKLTFCAVHLFLNLITGHQTKVIGTMTGWCCSLKIASMFWSVSIHINEFLFLFDHSCGHDECETEERRKTTHNIWSWWSIFRRYLLRKKSMVLSGWNICAGTKDDGQRVMIISFQTRELGFGMALSKE